MRHLIIRAWRRLFYRNPKLQGIGRRLLSDKNSKMYRNKMHFEIDNSIDTACWSFNGNEHLIKCSSKCVKNVANVKTQQDSRLSTNLLKEVLRHELAHAHYTCRIGTKITDELQNEKIPFRLFNLFEDCFIEYMIVKDYPEYKKFFWHRFIDIDEKVNDASNAIYVLKLKEAFTRMKGSKSNNLTRFLPELDYQNGLHKKVRAHFNKKLRNGLRMQSAEYKTNIAICKYYEAYIDASIEYYNHDSDKNLKNKISVLKAWIDSFGINAPKVYDKQNIVNGVADPNAKNAGFGIGTKNTDSGDTSNCDYDDICNRGYDMIPEEKAMSERLFGRLKPICKKAITSKNRLSVTGNKLHLKNAISRVENCFRSFGKSKAKLSIICFVDFSGSMTDTWKHNGGKEFISALKLLKERNLIDAKIIISWNQNNYEIHNDSINDILSIEPCGNHENLANNLIKYKDELKKNDLVLLFTDGCLTGNIPDEESYRKSGVELVASCICKEHDISYIRQHCNGYFTKSIIDTNPYSLSKRLLEYMIKKR